ncbi:hypothetical protein [Chitinophaga arvensicola]|uniref:Uncharacterized protein n=1 Tax=Chitinophaga arvensicola TaxID=29529 RepID=A0A1I0SBK3_9BACT|nr:hypothetical protein [Chitinophaga arvensicola]SEW53945.1 hypothetical protein SAMN04488122_5785 [Chitinophaga arvensicola]
MKKKYFITSLLLLAASLSSGQNAWNTREKDSTNIYYQALKAYFGQYPTAQKQTVLIEENTTTTKSIPPQMGVFRIELLGWTDIEDRLKKKDTINLIRIVPLNVEDGKFSIAIIPFDVVKTSKGLHYINSGGSNIEFLYDCVEKRFDVRGVKSFSL